VPFVSLIVFTDCFLLASRLEGLTKFYKVDVIVSEGTHHRLKRPQNYNFRLLDIVRPKGKAEAIRVYELIDAEFDDGLRGRKIATKDRFNDAVMLYQKKNFALALEKFEEVIAIAFDDAVAKMYRDRCRKMLDRVATGYKVDTWDAVEVSWCMSSEYWGLFSRSVCLSTDYVRQMIASSLELSLCTFGYPCTYSEHLQADTLAIYSQFM
jgi:hypothetical protein